MTPEEMQAVLDSCEDSYGCITGEGVIWVREGEPGFEEAKANYEKRFKEMLSCK